MQEIPIEASMLKQIEAEVPDSLQEALNPEWLSVVLAHIADGSKVATVELTDVVKAMAAKVRVRVTFEQNPDLAYCLCIKGFLDHDLGQGAGDITTFREAGFYAEIAPQITMRTPPCASIVTDRKANRAILVMADMIAAGVHFYNALEPLTPDQVAETLDQLARLHARADLLDNRSWIPCRLNEITTREPPVSWDEVQQLMHDERRGDLPDRTVDAELLKRGMAALAEWNTTAPQTLLHGDSHPGNIYRTRDSQLGFTDWQLVQKGHWSLDVAYHIASVLPVEVAEKEERYLLNHYLDALQRHGGEAPDRETGWKDYRRSQVYGYFHWAITRRVDPPIIHQAFKRLGAAVTRHETYKLLGL